MSNRCNLNSDLSSRVGSLGPVYPGERPSGEGECQTGDLQPTGDLHPASICMSRRNKLLWP